MTISEGIKEMLSIVDKLRQTHLSKAFTLDGRLVGDLGEVLCEQSYQLKLFDKIEKHFDAKTPEGRFVQIKTTMKESLGFPTDHVPQYYLGIKIHPDGSFDEIYNGPGTLIWDEIKHRKEPKNKLHNVSVKILQKLNSAVAETDRIERRRPNSL